MNKIAAFCLITFTSIALTCCKKDEKVNGGAATKDNPSSIMLKYISSHSKPDYTVLVSSARGFSLYEESPTTIDESTSSGIEAYSKELESVGRLFVNEKEIPFGKKTYFYQIDGENNSPTKTTDFTGTVNKYKFISNDASKVPDFTIEKYSPAVNSLTFKGINSNKKINLADGFTLHWIPDTRSPQKYVHGLVIFSADDENGNPVIKYEEVDDNTGYYTAHSNNLAEFINYGYVRVYYARGYSSVEDIDNKNVEFQFLTYGWAHLLFEQ